MMTEKDFSEIMRYLGRRGQQIPAELEALAGECLRELREAAAPRYVRAVFGVLEDEQGVALENTRVLMRGGDIRRHLLSCRRAVIFAATLGVGADAAIRRAQSRDITRALVLDACAAVLIEDLCDEAQDEIRAEAAKERLGITARYSPGYGDFPLDIQPKLLSLLDAERKIGLTCSESLIMLPRKSVTAIIGIRNGAYEAKEPDAERSGCGSCANNKNCSLRR